MPTRPRKGVPGKCTLPSGFVHNPGASANGLLSLLGSLVQQPMSLGQLAAPPMPWQVKLPYFV